MSAPINDQDAIQMVKAYLAHNNKIPRLTETNDVVALKGLRIAKEDLLYILEHENHTNVNEIFLAFAVRQQDLGKPQSEQCFTTVAIGLNDNNEVLMDTAVDFLEPCPSNCPNNYADVFETI